MTAASSNGLRIDKWLWHARFFKSRSAATDAVAGGRVHVNGERCKPSRDVSIGDQLTVSRDDNHIEVMVLSLPVRRGPASEAQRCYQETDASSTRRAAVREQRRFAPPAPQGKPDKHARRALRSLKGF